MKMLYIGLITVSVLIAAALMTFFAEGSPLAFVGWSVFFAVFFGPVLYFGRNSRFACRLFGRS